MLDVSTPGWLVTSVKGISVPARNRHIIDKTVFKTPNYLQLKADGKLLPNNPYSFRERIINYTHGNFRDISKSTGKIVNYWEGDHQSYLEPNYLGDIRTNLIEPSQGLKDRLVAKLDNGLLSDLKDQKINLAQAFAEREQSVNLITNSLTRLAKGFRAARRGDLTGLAKAIGFHPSQKAIKLFRKQRVNDNFQAAANLWLEAQYGWRPLLNDVYAAVEIFKEPLPRVVGYVKKRVREEQRDVIYKSDTYFKQQLIRSVTVRRQKCIWFALDDNAASTLTTSASKLGLTNPLLIAWELMPWSFVVDWFFPVGNYLNTLDATFGLKFVDGYYTDVWDRSMKRVVTGAGLPGGSSIFTLGFGEGSYEEKWMTRSRVTSFPSPVFPRLKNPLSVEHAANALALFTTAFKR